MKKQCCPELPFKKATHVIFGLDGTILDSEPLMVSVLTEICAAYGQPFDPNLMKRTSGATVEDVSKIMIDDIGLPIDYDEFIQLYNEKMLANAMDIELKPGAEALIRHFASNQIPMAVATSCAEDLMLVKTQRYKSLFDLFSHIVCGSDQDVITGKPAPDIFLATASRFPDTPDASSCLVLENSEHGLSGALRAGMQVVMIPADYISYEVWKEATVRLDSLEFMAPELFGMPPLVMNGVPIPKISFNMHFEDEEKDKREAKEERKSVNEDDVKKEQADAVSYEEPTFRSASEAGVEMFDQKVYQ